MRLGAIAEVSRAVAGTAARLEKVGHLAGLLARVPPGEIAIVIAFLSGEPRQGRMKIGGAVLSGLREPETFGLVQELSDFITAAGRLDREPARMQWRDPSANSNL